MAYLDPYNDNTTTGDDSSLWSWLLEQQKRTRGANRFMPEADGTVINWKNNPYLVLPGEDGKITENSILKEADYILRLRSMSMKNRKVFQQQLKSAGYLAPDYIANGLLDTDNAFLSAAVGLARTVSAENFAIATDEAQPWLKRKPISTDDYIKMMSGRKAGYSRTSVQKSVSSFTSGESRGILESFYGDALGRRPTEAEVKKFQKAINIAAKSNPNVTTTVSGENSSTSTSKEGYSQADAELKARNMAESQVGAAGYISSTKYMDTFMKVLNQGRSEF